MNDFKVVDLLSKGDVADIWQGIHVATNTEVHVVTVNKKVNGQIFDQRRMMELEPLVSQLNHPNMLKYHKIVQNDNTIGIIMEHPKGGCLRDYLLRRPDKRLSENEARTFFKQIVSAVEYVHKHGVVFRNLNLRNIFIDNNQIKMGDFLICTKVGPIYKPSSTSSSYHFYAPEIWLEDGKKINSSADLWSLGVLLYVMTCGCYPFDGKHEFDIFLSVRRGQFAIPSSLSDECASLIKAILNPDISKRLTTAEIKAHPWCIGVPNSVSVALKPRILHSRPLGGIPEEEEETRPDSPMTVTYKMSQMALKGQQPQPMRPAVYNFNVGDSYLPPQINHHNFEENQFQEEPQILGFNRKRPGEDVQKVIASYFRLKQEDNQQNVSSFISKALNQPPISLSRSPSFGAYNVDEESALRAPKRRNSDSVLHNEDVMKALGLSQPLDDSVNSFAPFTQGAQQPISRARSSSETRMRRVASASATSKPRKPRSRRTSSESIAVSNAASLQDFNHILSHGLFLPEQQQTPNSQYHQNINSNSMAQHTTRHQPERDERLAEQYSLLTEPNSSHPTSTVPTGGLYDISQQQKNQRSLTAQLLDQPSFLEPELQRQIDNLNSEMNDIGSLDIFLESSSPDQDWFQL